MKIVGRIEGAKELHRKLERAPSIAKAGVWRAIRKVAFAIMGRIKRNMPVDTGRARSSWGIWTSGDIQKPNILAQPDDAVWQENQAGLTHTQGSNVPYIVYLNEGHSAQAPKGFIDRAVRAGVRELEKEIERALEGII